MKKVGTFFIAGAALACGLSLPTGFAAEVEPVNPPASERPNEGSQMGGDLTADQVAEMAACVELGMYTRPDGTCYQSGYLDTGTNTPTAPGQVVPLPYCADGVTESDGTCEVNWDQITLTDTDPIDIESEVHPVTAWDGTPVPEWGVETYMATGEVPAIGEVVEIDPAEVTPGVANEDQPGWDCRTMGNLKCGVFIVDQWYIVEFSAGVPASVYPRGF